MSDMNRLPKAQRAQILHLLCEGSSIRSITRLTGASKTTILKLLANAGRAFSDYQDRVLRNLNCKRVQTDEIWSFLYAKKSNVATAKAAPGDAGDVWTWTAIDADTKLLVNWSVGARDTETALYFLDDLRGRVANRFQLTSDGWKPYLQAVDTIFGDEIDYGMLNKIYGPSPEGQRRYSPPRLIHTVTGAVKGNPDSKHISTSFVERHNLTMRMHMRRFTRLTNGFSKKIENHVAAVALHSMFYNFVKVHQSLRITPAMAAGVTDRLWEMSDLIEVLEAFEAKEKRDSRPIFEVKGWKIGGGFYVKVSFPDEMPEDIQGFNSEDEAWRWVRNESAAWLYARRIEKKEVAN